MKALSEIDFIDIEACADGSSCFTVVCHVAQGVPTVLIARTDADSATLLTSDVDDADKAFCTGDRTPEGFFKVRSGVEVRAALVLHPSACVRNDLRPCQNPDLELTPDPGLPSHTCFHHQPA